MTPDIGPYFWLLFKALTLLGLVIYIIFAVVVVRQEQLMTKVLEAASEKMLRILALLHLAASIFIFFLALVIL